MPLSERFKWQRSDTKVGRKLGFSLNGRHMALSKDALFPHIPFKGFGPSKPSPPSSQAGERLDAAFWLRLGACSEFVRSHSFSPA